MKRRRQRQGRAKDKPFKLPPIPPFLLKLIEKGAPVQKAPAPVLGQSAAVDVGLEDKWHFISGRCLYPSSRGQIIFIMSDGQGGILKCVLDLDCHIYSFTNKAGQRVSRCVSPSVIRDNFNSGLWIEERR